MSLPSGTRLRPYEILGPLGAGGMGEVYRARDTKLDRDVAIKVLPRHLASDPEALERFEREAKAIAALSHPNILAIHDFGRVDGTAFAVTELLEGETLRDRLSAGALPQKKALQFARDIARGLAAAHDKRIVHRDLKPENVFIGADGQVKILDFGLAKTAEPTASNTRTELRTDPGMVMGTVGYMSPEQAKGQPADPRSDIFSLGCLLFEMVAGRRPFQRETIAETMAAILREDPPELAAEGGTTSPALDELIRHCLEKRQDERFQSARDLAFALQALSGPQTTSGRSAVAASSDTPSSTRWLLPLLVPAVVVIAAFFAGRFLPASDGSSPTTILSFDQATDSPGVETTPTLSPDGRSIVYAVRAVAPRTCISCASAAGAPSGSRPTRPSETPRRRFHRTASAWRFGPSATAAASSP